jgi:hypothetical protein
MPSPQLPASVMATVISHDRWFLDRIATHVLAFEGDSQVAWFEGTTRGTSSGLPAVETLAQISTGRGGLAVSLDAPC